MKFISKCFYWQNRLCPDLGPLLELGGVFPEYVGCKGGCQSARKVDGNFRAGTRVLRSPRKAVPTPAEHTSTSASSARRAGCAPNFHSRIHYHRRAAYSLDMTRASVANRHARSRFPFSTSTDCRASGFPGLSAVKRCSSFHLKARLPTCASLTRCFNQPRAKVGKHF